MKLLDLIDRMSIDEPPTNSDQSVTWQAHREAEQLVDPKLVPELVATLGCEKDKRRRSAICFAIGKIGKNTGDSDCTKALIRQVEIEEDEQNLSSLFDLLADGPKLSDHEAETIACFLGDPRWLVRHAAIQALSNAASSRPEEAVLKHLAETTEKFDQIYCHVALRNIGTLKSLPLLEQGRKSRKRDVKTSAELAIQAIRERNETEE